MVFRQVTSRLRFRDYLSSVKQRGARGAEPAADGTPKQPAKVSRSFLQLVRLFVQLLHGYRLDLAVALATLSVATLLKLLPPAVTKLTIDCVLSNHPLPPLAVDWLGLPTNRQQLLYALAAAMVVISVVGTFIHLWGRWFATRVTKRVQVAIRRRAFEHAVRLPLHRVYQLKSGGVASMLREDAGGVAELIFSMVYNPWRAVIQLLGSLTVLAWVDWRLLLGSLLVAPAIYLSHRTWIGRIRPLFRDVRKQRQEIDGHATEAFGGMRVVRAFGRQRSETNRFTRSNHFMARQELHAWWWMRTVEAFWEVLVPLTSAGLLVYGGTQVLAGALSLGDLMMFLIYLTMLLGPIETLVSSATEFQNSLAGLDRTLDLLEEPVEMPDTPGSRAVAAETVRGRVTVANVSFRYPGATDLVLKEVNLEAEPGQMIALVGSSGAGKTTLCNLIARFYDPTEGAVRLDGIDLRDIKVESYRNLLGIVEQDIFLFDGTIAENIAYAKRDASLEDIRRAARVANAEEFITRLDQGYETVIGERGVRLSGGQRQRLAIARAVLADPRILILDEATSSLDTKSERLIQKSLRALMRGRTSFVIAHRLSTVRHADLIVVLEQGRIVETGTHEALMATSSRYHDMVRSQMGTEEAVFAGADG